MRTIPRLIRAAPVATTLLSHLIMSQHQISAQAPAPPATTPPATTPVTPMPPVVPPPPQPAPIMVVSPEVLPDRRTAFRLLAPKAEAVRLTGGDIPGLGPGAAMTKNENGVWEVTLGPLEPGAYRYAFNVDGTTVIDPRSSAISESNTNVWSLVNVPGSDWMDTKNVPHGAVAAVTYYSSALSKFRRMHVYTPPGYERGGTERFPVLYLLHGAGDNDDAWSSVGRAGFILDNLIAAGRAKPMIVVMPAGHARASFPGPGSAGPRPPVDEFEQDFMRDVLPTIEKNYRVVADRNHRAIAGLSMGGGQTLNLFMPHQEQFGYVGVFSSGLFGAFPFRRPGDTTPAVASTTRSPWEEQHLAKLDNAGWKKGLKLLWFSTGKDDFLLQTTRSTVDLLKKHGFNPVYAESAGGHTWSNWRNYLIEFAPLLFQ
jgi:enterochelin esterase-like enzyme